MYSINPKTGIDSFSENVRFVEVQFLAYQEHRQQSESKWR